MPVYFRINMMNNARLLLLIILSSVLFSPKISAQEKKRVEILNSGYGESAPSIGPNVQRLVDSVYIRHNEILMWCDTAYMYSGTNKVDAYGRVHIKQGDTLHLYANNVTYDGDIEFARAWENVKLINKSTTIYSDTLDYDLKENVSYYDDSGKIIDSTMTLTSQIGRYFIDLDQIYFYRDVHAYDEEFDLYSDTVLYETETGRIYVDGPTTIRDSLNTLYTQDGWYDSNTGEAELSKNPIVFGETQQLKAEFIRYNQANGEGMAKGGVRIEDSPNRSIVSGELAIYNELLEIATISDSAVYISYNETDTFYLHADTLRTSPDTAEGEKVIEAFYGVRFYRTDMQGICDSLVYYTRDSLIQLYDQPVIWSEIHQLSANYIEMKQRANAPDELHMNGSSFIISEQDTGQFDQIKGKELVGYISNQQLDSIHVNGNGQTLYYAREEESIIGLNKSESSKIKINFRDGKIYRILFLKKPIGELKPLSKLEDGDKFLPEFDWKKKARPVSHLDIFRDANDPPVYFTPMILPKE